MENRTFKQAMLRKNFVQMVDYNGNQCDNGDHGDEKGNSDTGVPRLFCF